jgi:peroxin-4
LQASKRLRKELQTIQKQQQVQQQKWMVRLQKEQQGSSTDAIMDENDDDDDIYLECNQDNILQWNAWIKPSKSANTPFSPGVFQLQILCSSDYPLSPPSIKFMTKIFHPNVHFRTGDICLDILKKEWSPAWGIQASCRAILALLADPDAGSPLNCDAGNMIRSHDLVAYEATAHMYTMENALFITWPPQQQAAIKMKQQTGEQPVVE